MFGRLKLTSGRIAIAVALGFAFGGIGTGSNTAKAADLGGDCCADLEERVAELEATTVRKGNKKVSVTLSGWVVKTVNWWDDGDIDHLIVGDKDYDLGSRFAITGSAQIAPGWSAGFNMTVLAPSTVFGFNADQFDDTAGTYGSISTLYSYMFIKSDTLGTLNWGHLSPASDNPAVLADISGTVIESNFVFFEGNGFLLRPDGAGGDIAGLSGLTWGNFLQCQGLGAGIGVDCWGAAQPAVRYDSPTWGGFSFKASYGANRLTGPFDQADDSDFADIALFYAKEWERWKLSAAAAYTWIETGINTGEETDLFQAGGSIIHKPSGLGVYGIYQTEESGGSFNTLVGFEGADIVDALANPVFFRSDNPDTDAWGVKPFWRKTLTPLGATIFYGEYGQYNDQFSAGFGSICGAFAGLGGTNVNNFCTDFSLTDPGFINSGVFVTGSEVERYGLGVVQEIDAAAMHVFARWQHQELNVSAVGFTQNFENCGGNPLLCDFSVSRRRVRQGFDDWDLFQVGGIIFF